MKRFLSTLGGIILCIIFTPLLLMLLFGMPLEFLVASWHLYRVDSKTEGTVIESAVTRHNGNEGSFIRYSYSAKGTNFTSKRVQAGLISNRSYEDGGGIFARKSPVGSPVTVYYDSSNPSFSLLAPGWPKWSLGFSMSVWGLLLSACFPLKSFTLPWGAVAYSATRAICYSGFLTIILLPITIETGDLLKVALLFGVSFAGAFLYGMIRKSKGSLNTGAL